MNLKARRELQEATERRKAALAMNTYRVPDHGRHPQAPPVLLEADGAAGEVEGGRGAVQLPRCPAASLLVGHQGHPGAGERSPRPRLTAASAAGWALPELRGQGKARGRHGDKPSPSAGPAPPAPPPRGRRAAPGPAPAAAARGGHGLSAPPEWERRSSAAEPGPSQPGQQRWAGLEGPRSAPAPRPRRERGQGGSEAVPGPWRGRRRREGPGAA